MGGGGGVGGESWFKYIFGKKCNGSVGERTFY